MALSDLIQRIHGGPVALRALIWIGLGAIAAMGQAPFGLPVISLLGFAGAFLIFQNLRVESYRFYDGWLFGLGYFLITMQWLISPFMVEPEQHAWMAPFAVFAMAGGLALFWAIAFTLAKRIGRLSSLIVTLALAELARAYLFTGFPWGMPAYGLVDSALGQGAAWVGSHGLNFIFFAISLFMVTALTRAGWRRIPAGALAAIGITLVVWPAPEAIKPAEDAEVIRIIQPNAAQREKWDPDLMPEIFDRSLMLTRSPSDRSSDLIVWPETSLPDILNYSDDLIAQISEAAGLTPVVVGANRFEGARLYNSAVLISSQGEVLDTYDKHHIVPFGEYIPFGETFKRFGIYSFASSEGRGFSAGPGPQVIDLGPIGIATPLICYEVVFPQDVRTVDRRADMLLQITNDAWFGTFSGPYQHLVQAQMRSIETGLPMVRAANTGISAMIDARGRIVNSLPLNEAGYLDVQKQRAFAQPLYDWMGDVPVLAFLVLLLAGHYVTRPKKST